LSSTRRSIGTWTGRRRHRTRQNIAWQRDGDKAAPGQIAAVGVSHGSLDGCRTHRGIRGDGIVMEIDLVVTTIGPAQDREQIRLHAMTIVKTVTVLLAASLPL